MDMIYAGIMMTAMGAGFLVARWNQRKIGLTHWQRIGIGLGAFIGAMIGAKLPFLFDDWDRFLSGAAWFSDGKTILTGLVGGYLGVEAAKWSLDVRVKTGDSFAVPVAAAIAIGRLGCFHAGCCYGTPTDLPWGVAFPNVDSLTRHPTQLYESVFHAAMVGVMLMLAAHNKFEGQRVKLYIIAYAIYRFASEWLRPEAKIYGGLTGYQLASVMIVGLMAWLWVRDRRSCVRDFSERKTTGENHSSQTSAL